MRTLTIKLSALTFFAISCQNQDVTVPSQKSDCRYDCEDLIECTIDSLDTDQCSCLHELDHELCVISAGGDPIFSSDSPDPKKYPPGGICAPQCLDDGNDTDCYYPIGYEDSGCRLSNAPCTPTTEKTDCPPLADGCLTGRCDLKTKSCFYFLDADGDGHTPLSCKHTSADDCDDTRHNVYPDKGECLDGIDNDCDGLIDNTRDRFDCHTSLVNAPSERWGHTAIWTGGEMIVWGGTNALSCCPKGAALNTGGKYDPLTDMWTPVATSNAPSPRSNHTAIWTGSEMIIWGGQRRGETFNNGSRYNPESDYWTPISTIGAPSPSAGHNALWTGSEMIIWRGGSGGRYDPKRNVWIPIRDLDPEYCGGTAIWTGSDGSEMIVLGDGGNYWCGSKYNPINNQWTSITAFNTTVPFGTARWAEDCNPMPGTQGCVIIWNSMDRYGVQYFPGDDRWQSISPLNAPTERQYYTAIWTGSEMIVWGGRGLDNQDDGINDAGGTGGKYSPISNRWEATPDLGPEVVPRWGHTAIWTGDEMIVWGGIFSNGQLLNHGGRYAP